MSRHSASTGRNVHGGRLLSCRWLAVAMTAAVLAWPVSAHQPDRPSAVERDAFGEALAPGESRILQRGLPQIMFFAGALGQPPAPVYRPDPPTAAMQQEFAKNNYKRDPKSGNYLSPKVLAKTLDEELVPIFINAVYMKDLKGQTIFLRRSIRDRLYDADKAMYEKKKQHVLVNYGFRSNTLQRELFQKLNGVGKVAPAGGSFHETGMALDLQNWRDAQRFMIEAGFVGGCYGIEEDLVHYSVGEVTKASNAEAFKRCTLKEIPENILKGVKKVGSATGGLLGKIKRK